MPFCEYCGKPIAEDEICNCKNEVKLSPPYLSDQNNYYNPQVTTQKKSGGLWWIWLIIIPVILLILFILGIIAAIFVPAFIGYNKKSKVTSANANASSVYKAANTALVEFDEEGYNIEGFYIISSDENNNWNVPNNKFDINEFYNKLDKYYYDSDNYEWFVIIENGVATYAALSENWSTEIVGTYPIRATIDGPGIYGRYTAATNKYSLTRVYNEAAITLNDKLNNNSSNYSFY